MSSSIAIPKRKAKAGGSGAAGYSVSASSTFAGSSSSANSSSSPAGRGFAYGSYGSNAEGSEASPSGSLRDEGKMRRQSLMSATFSKAEHTVINVGDSESPRLITCVKASQGFDWNQEIFLPSYADYHFDDLERRQDPVQDIILTDEEIKNMFPS
ncbi:Nn.00g111460.m01.CDS01 [Neocucurbitaria sp. VM-36]